MNDVTPQNESQVIKFETLPSLTEEETQRLFEVDEKLLARIDAAIPGTLQMLTAASNWQAAGQLYQAIIPQGAMLANSQAMSGAVRGIYHGANGIQGQANFVAANTAASQALNLASAAMGVASIVVGQYYMHQISQQLKDISARINDIKTILESEYMGKLEQLFNEVETIAKFQAETLGDEEQRKRDLDALRDCQRRCEDLLGQANNIIKNIATTDEPDYECYENHVIEAIKWFPSQPLLVQILYKISIMNYVLSHGKLSKDRCFSSYHKLAPQTQETRKSLFSWNMNCIGKFQIDIKKKERNREGILPWIAKNNKWTYLAMFRLGETMFKDVLGVTNPSNESEQAFRDGMPIATFMDDQSFAEKLMCRKSIDENKIQLIERLNAIDPEIVSAKSIDPFHQEVRLVAKEGKLYFLPPPAPRPSIPRETVWIKNGHEIKLPRTEG